MKKSRKKTVCSQSHSHHLLLNNQSETFIILGKHAVYLQSPRLCSSRKYPYTPTKDKGNSEEGGKGVQKAAISEGKEMA